MVFKLYGMGVSTCTQKVVMALKEKSIPFDFININVLKGEQKTPENIARHPFGKIPILEDESGFRIFESLAICRYIDNLEPNKGARLIPADIKTAALVEQWVSSSVYNFYPPAQGIITERAIKPVAGRPTDEAAAVEHRKKLIPVLDIYDKQLAGHDFFVGNEFTLADLSHLPYFNVINRVEGNLIKERPNLAAWFERCTSKSTWLEVMGFVHDAPKCH
ncbi:Glutathione S-transferase 5 [Umbelopsis nana]